MRVIVIGLDGATWDLIKPWTDEGKLPTFKKLMAEGAWGTLKSLDLPISSSSWTTITTGVNPGKHGIFDFSVRRENSYDTRPLSSKEVKYLRVWDVLGNYGKKSYIINVPMTYPPEKINGAMISGFPCPEELNNFSQPPEFIEELRDAIDRDIHFQPRISPHQEAEFLDEMLKITEFVEATIVYIIKNNDFDLLMSVFAGPDAVGHTFFKYLDKDHPIYEENDELSQGILKIYISLDGALKTIIRMLKENDHKLFLVSDHGFTSVYYSVALNKWLIEKGYLSLKKDPLTLFKKYLFKIGITYENLFKVIKMLRLVKKAQKQAYREESSLTQKMMHKVLNSIMIGWYDIDWSRTKAYSQGNFGQIFVNLVGREPKGIVESEEYDDLLEKIMCDLQEFRYHNEIVFDVIKKGKKIYTGPFADIGPDILSLNSNFIYIVSRFFEFGSNKTITVHPVWSGTHDRNGIFLAWDNIKDISQGKKISAKVCDVTPSLLHLFNTPIPRDVDGKVLKEIFNRTCSVKSSQIKGLGEIFTEKRK